MYEIFKWTVAVVGLGVMGLLALQASLVILIFALDWLNHLASGRTNK